MKIAISSDAERDIADSYWFYENRESGLGDYFRSSVISDIESLAVTMRIVLVGNRDGKAVINWSGVLATTLICGALGMAGFGLATLVIPIPWFSLVSLVFAAVLSVSVVSIWVLISLRLPVEKLTPLD